MDNKIKINGDETLNQYVHDKLAKIDKDICNTIYARAVKIMGYAGMRQHGPKVMGKYAYKCAIRERRVPSLKQLNKAATNLHMEVVIEAKEEGKQGKSVPICYPIDREFTQSGLVSFMHAVAKSPRACLASPELKRWQKEELRRVSQSRAAIRWKSLIGFFAACGYEMNVWLKDTISANEASLLSRLNYPD